MSINHKITPCVRLSIGLDKCPHSFGNAPCRAVFDGTKGKCFNTLATCQSIPDYETGILDRTYRFCTAGVLIDGYNPMIEAYAVSPSAIKSDYKIYRKERISIRFADYVGADNEIDDDYQNERGGGLANASPAINTRSSWWARLIRRNRFFNRRPALFEIGYVDFENIFHATRTHHLFVDNINRQSRSGSVTIEITDGIKLKKDDGAVVPAVSDIELIEDLNESATEIFLKAGLSDRFEGVQHISIGSEIMTLNNFVDDTVNTILLVARAAGGSEAKSHDDGDTVELCHTIENVNIVDVVRTILSDFCDIGGAQIDHAGFDEERNNALAFYRCNAIIAKPTESEKMIEELQQSGLFNIWYDSNANLIRIRSVVNLSLIGEDTPSLSDDDIIGSTLEIGDEPRKSISRVFVYTNPVDFANVKKDNDKWRNLSVAVNSTVEATQARGEAVAAIVYSRFINATIANTMAARLLLTGDLSSGKIKLDLPIRAGAPEINVGDNIPLRSWQAVDENGNSEEYVFRVLEIISRNAERMTVKGVRTIYGGAGFRPFLIGVSEIGSDTDLIV